MNNTEDIQPRLLGKTLDGLQEIVSGLGMPKFTARQICEWLYQQGVTDISRMLNISLKNRELLAGAYTVGVREPSSFMESSDGTRKYLFGVSENGFVETAYIPDKERATLCVSSQVGCRMGCRFCMTGRQGLKGNLDAGDIINQIRSVPQIASLTNIVYMGMGEPLDNYRPVLDSLDIMTSDWGYGWSPSRITLSTIGVLPDMEKFLRESKVNLAVSLHNPFHEERMQIMPCEKVWPASEIINVLRKYDFSGQRRVSFEYIVMKGLNDSARHVNELAKLLNGLRCRINLIKFHKIPSSPFFSPPDKEMAAFRDALTRKGIITTIRTSRGEDIEAACGMLSTSELIKSRY